MQEKLNGPKTEEGERRQERILGLIPALFFFLSAAVYGSMFTDPAESHVGEHMILTVIMLIADLAAGVYIVEKTLSREPEKEIPSATRRDEEKIIRMQNVFCCSMIICAFLTVAIILTSDRMGHVLMFVVPAMVLASAFVCLKYFAFEVEDLDFPEIAVTVIIGIFLLMIFDLDIVVNVWAKGMALAVLGLASFSVTHSGSFLRENCRIITIIITAGAILVLSYTFIIGINYTIITDERMVTFTVTDMDAQTEESSTEDKYFTLYVTNEAEGYYDEPVSVFEETYNSLKIGETIELKERVSIFNVKMLMEPAKTERGALVEAAELLGSDNAADIALLAAALILGSIVAAATVMGFDMLLFFIAAFLGFGALAVYTFVLKESWWVWAIFGVISILSAIVLVWFLIECADDGYDDDE